MGGQKSVTKKQQTNEQTNTTDDHNSPSGFFQNHRANKQQYLIGKTLNYNKKNSAALAIALGAVKL